MYRSGRVAIKVIVVMGMLAFAGLYLSSLTLKRTIQPNERERVTVARKVGPFDSARAFSDIERMLALGPRPAGSPALATLREYLTGELRRAGLTVREQAFTADTAHGPVTMTNLTGILHGPRDGTIVIGTHYDTMPAEDFTFLGANSAAAGTACLLELARVLGREWRGRTLCFVWFDGGEANPTQPWQGSRAYVEDLRKSRELSALRAAIVVTRVGDCYLTLNRDPAAPEWLTDVVWDHAAYRGYGFHFGRGALNILDDHAAFREAGVPSIALLDASYGGSRAEHSRNWRSAGDILERICPESLQAVGDVIYDSLSAIDARLDVSPEG